MGVNFKALDVNLDAEKNRLTWGKVLAKTRRGLTKPAGEERHPSGLIASALLVPFACRQNPL